MSQFYECFVNYEDPTLWLQVMERHCGLNPHLFLTISQTLEYLLCNSLQMRISILQKSQHSVPLSVNCNLWTGLLKKCDEENDFNGLRAVLKLVAHLLLLDSKSDKTSNCSLDDIELRKLDIDSIEQKLPGFMTLLCNLLNSRDFHLGVMADIVCIIHELHVRFIGKQPREWLSHLPKSLSDSLVKVQTKVSALGVAVMDTHDPKCIGNVTCQIEELLSRLPLYHKPSFCEKLENDLVLNPLPEDDLGNFMVCPITLKIMQDPVTLSDGHCYERSAIVKW
jgi:hypothetical protein